MMEDHKECWCSFEKKMQIFARTESPSGYWVCTGSGCFNKYKDGEEPKVEPIKRGVYY